MRKLIILSAFFMLTASHAWATPPVLPDPKPHLVSVQFAFPADYQTSEDGVFKVVAYLEAKEDIDTLLLGIRATKNLELDVDLPEFSGGMLAGQRFHIKISGKMKNIEDMFESLHLLVEYGKKPQVRRISRILSIQPGWPSLIPPEGLKTRGRLSETTFTDWMMYRTADKEALLNEAFKGHHIKVENNPQQLIPALTEMYTHCDAKCKSMNIAEVLQNLDTMHVIK